MDVNDLRRVIETALAAQEFPLPSAADDTFPAGIDVPGQVRRYVLGVPVLLEALRKHESLNRYVALVDGVQSFWLDPLDVRYGSSPAVTLLARAYLSHRVVQAVDDRTKGVGQKGLLPTAFADANGLVRGLLEDAGVSGEALDVRVEGVLSTPAVRIALNNLMLVAPEPLDLPGPEFAPVGEPLAPGVSAAPPADHQEWRGAPSDAAPGARPRADKDGWDYDVWFGTNRARAAGDRVSGAFENRRDERGSVHFGICTVHVPRTHVFGSRGAAWWRPWSSEGKLGPGEAHVFSDSDEFFDQLRKELGDTASANARYVLIYLHGYRVSFEQAVTGAAQIGFDLKVPGATAVFSWPSAGAVGGYFVDRARIEASEAEIAAFITRMCRDAGATRVTIVAHSMGNQGLARAIQRIMSSTESARDVLLHRIILAAPDISVELFRDLARLYPRLCPRTTMYISGKDRALWLSRFFQSSQRAGFTPPITIVNGIDTVEVTDIDLTLLGHGYWAEAAPVLNDLYQLIHTDAPPASRARLMRELSDDGREYWRIGS